MRELTAREEQEMIKKAQAGDPEANYRLSFWALDQAAAEPEEERWNRLAAKCLVKSAEAGYAPAQERMAQLLREMDEREKAAAPAPETPAPVRTESPRRATRTQDPAPRKSAPAGGKITSIASGAAEKGKALLGRASGLLTGGTLGEDAQEDSARWKKLQLVCTIACVVLVLLIVLMIVTGKNNRADREDGPNMPAAATAEPVMPTATPEPYPDAETRAAIQGELLDIFPANEDYVSEATTAVIDGEMLRLRMGPDTNYDQITEMDGGARVSVYARRNGWALVLYNNERYGWCSEEYLDIE